MLPQFAEASTAPDEIYSNKTGFITTYGMLEKRVNEICFAAAHNAFANNQDRRSSWSWDTYKDGHNLGTMNHDISIKKMLEVGYRYIDLDIGDNGNDKTGCYHRYRLAGYTNLNGNNGILPKIKSFLDEYPKEIVIIYISDVYNGTIDLTKLRHNATLQPGTEDYEIQFKNVLDDMQDTGLLEMVYNYSGDEQTPYNDRHDLIQVPGQDIEWPILGDMINNNKRVLFLERDKGISVDIPFKNQNNDPNNTTVENLDLTDAFITNMLNQHSNKYVSSGYMNDWGAAAGDKDAAMINNNGSRIFDIIKTAYDTFKTNGVSNTINGVQVDYAAGRLSQGGYLEPTPVDATNRFNYYQFGYDWSEETVEQWYWE